MEQTDISYKLLLNKSECLQIVTKDINATNATGVTVKSYKIEKCSEELVGFMGEYYKLTINIKEMNCDSEKIFSYFVKSLPINNKIYRAELQRKRVIEKESAIYEHILPNVQRYSNEPLFPKSFLTRNDLMVLEDFNCPLQRLKQLQEYEVYSNKHHQIFMQHLAKFHAASLAWELTQGVNIGNKFKDILFELELTTSNVWYTTGIKSILYLAQNHPSYQYIEAQKFVSQKLYNILFNMEDYTKPSETQRNVLCHRDSWDRNIFWQYNSETNEPTSCRIVDFQLARYSPPAIDVLYYLCNYITDSKGREEYLRYYYSSLKMELKTLDLPEDLITLEEFKADCKRALLPVLVNCALCEPLMKLPKGWSQLVRASETEKYDYYMHCDRTEMFKRVAKLDETYMTTILRPIQEVMEYFGFKPSML